MPGPTRKPSERHYPITPIVSRKTARLWNVALDASADCPLWGAIYIITADSAQAAAEKAKRYAGESVGETNALARRLKRLGPLMVIDWQPIVLEVSEHV